MWTYWQDCKLFRSYGGLVRTPCTWTEAVVLMGQAKLTVLSLIWQSDKGILLIPQYIYLIRDYTKYLHPFSNELLRPITSPASDGFWFLPNNFLPSGLVWRNFINKTLSDWHMYQMDNVGKRSRDWLRLLHLGLWYDSISKLTWIIGIRDQRTRILHERVPS